MTPGAAERHPTGSVDRFRDMVVPDSGFGDDDGSATVELAAALAGHPPEAAAVVAALRGERLLVALVAVLESVDPLGSEKDSHMAAAMMTRADGRKALLAFSSVAAVALWRNDARPLPVASVDVARAALEDGAEAVVIDIAGPAQFALSGPALWAVAEGRELQPPWLDPEVALAVANAVDAELAGTRFRIDPGDDTDVVIVLTAGGASLDPGGVTALASRLSADPVLRSRLGGGLAIGVESPEH